MTLTSPAHALGRDGEAADAGGAAAVDDHHHLARAEVVERRVEGGHAARR
jgi:hypothetical protein